MEKHYSTSEMMYNSIVSEVFVYSKMRNSPKKNGQGYGMLLLIQNYARTSPRRM